MRRHRPKYKADEFSKYATNAGDGVGGSPSRMKKGTRKIFFMTKNQAIALFLVIFFSFFLLPSIFHLSYIDNETQNINDLLDGSSSMVVEDQMKHIEENNGEEKAKLKTSDGLDGQNVVENANEKMAEPMHVTLRYVMMIQIGL